MKDCFLSIPGEEVEAYQVQATGYTLLTPGQIVEARHAPSVFHRKRGWRRVRIGEHIDHIGGRCNRGGAVYSAELLSDYPPPESTGDLFARSEAGNG